MTSIAGWFFAIYACIAGECIGPRSLPVYETRDSCLRAAREFHETTIPDYDLRMIDCVRKVRG